MKLALYYHIPGEIKDNKCSFPAYFGVFIEAVANHVEELHLLVHEATGEDSELADYKITNNNVKIINIGQKTSAIHRALFPKSVLKKKLSLIEECEVLLVRSPTPLAHSFQRFLKNTKVFYLIVGSYHEGAIQIGKKGIKNFLLYHYFKYLNRLFEKKIKTTDILVNSPALFDQYKNDSKSIHLIRTSTIKSDDYYLKEESTIQPPIELLYTGRIEVVKGLLELVEATKLLTAMGHNVHLNIVGWEANTSETFTVQMKKLADELNISYKLTFHGKMKLGKELNDQYRRSDIYVMPSYHEGFPRTIWEAMANSLPVIATRVGGIPRILENEKNALLIEPKSASDIANAVVKIIEDNEIRVNLIKNGFELARENSLENQTSRMINVIEEHV